MNGRDLCPGGVGIPGLTTLPGPAGYSGSRLPSPCGNPAPARMRPGVVSTAARRALPYPSRKKDEVTNIIAYMKHSIALLINELSTIFPEEIDNLSGQGKGIRPNTGSAAKMKAGIMKFRGHNWQQRLKVSAYPVLFNS